jgi:hypothetical protein
VSGVVGTAYRFGKRRRPVRLATVMALAAGIAVVVAIVLAVMLRAIVTGQPAAERLRSRPRDQLPRYVVIEYGASSSGT